MEPQTSPQRLRQLLYWMKVPDDVRQNLDMDWLINNLSNYSAHPHYTEARLLITQMLEPNKHGKSRRVR